MNNHSPTKNLLAQSLIDTQKDLLLAMPNMERTIQVLGTNDPVILEQLKAAHQKQKNRAFQILDIYAADFSEAVSLPEQHLLYALTYRLMIRNHLNAKQRKHALKIMAKNGKYSFDWLRMSARGLINLYTYHNGKGDKAERALQGINEVNQHLRKYFWGLGQVTAILNLMEILDVMAKNNINQILAPQIEATQSLALEYLIQAKSLNNDSYSQTIFAMFVLDGKIKNLFLTASDAMENTSKNDFKSENSSQISSENLETSQSSNELNSDIIPERNEDALNWLDQELRHHLSDKKDSVTILEHRAKLELHAMQEVIGEIQNLYEAKDEEMKEEKDSLKCSDIQNTHHLFNKDPENNDLEHSEALTQTTNISNLSLPEKRS